MEKTIKTLRSLVSSAPASQADQNIAEHFPQLSVKAASNVRKDVQDFINGKTTESELTHWLSVAGL